jgi:hypothetical protein
MSSLAAKTRFRQLGTGAPSSGSPAGPYLRLDGTVDGYASQYWNFGAVAGGIGVNADEDVVADIRYFTDGLLRWIMRCNNAANTGGEVGSDWALASRNDDESPRFNVLTANRLTGIMDFYAEPTIGGISMSTYFGGGGSSIPWTTATGTADALSATFPVPLSGGLDGQVIRVRAAYANLTTVPTLVIPASGISGDITKNGGLPLAVGDIAGTEHELFLVIHDYVSIVQFELINPAVVGGGSGTVYSTAGADFDGGGTDISVGAYQDLYFPDACTILGNSILNNAAGSIEYSLWSDTYGNFPPTIADNICASAPPKTISAAKSKDLTLTGWTVAVAADTTIRVKITSCLGVQKSTLTLRIQK